MPDRHPPAPGTSRATRRRMPAGIIPRPSGRSILRPTPGPATANKHGLPGRFLPRSRPSPPGGAARNTATTKDRTMSDGKAGPAAGGPRSFRRTEHAPPPAEINSPEKSPAPRCRHFTLRYQAHIKVPQGGILRIEGAWQRETCVLDGRNSRTRANRYPGGRGPASVKWPRPAPHGGARTSKRHGCASSSSDFWPISGWMNLNLLNF